MGSIVPEAAGTPPSDHARTLVQGAYDLHVHIAPDVPKRRIDDRALAERFSELGLAGMLIPEVYGGSGIGNVGEVWAEDVGWDGQPASASLRVPPLGVIWLMAD